MKLGNINQLHKAGKLCVVPPSYASQFLAVVADLVSSYLKTCLTLSLSMHGTTLKLFSFKLCSIDPC